MTRGRSESCGSMEDMLKRKKDESEVGAGKEEEVFRASKKTVKSPDVEKGKKEGMEEIWRLREEIREVKG